jgi:hypothetical protein
MLFHEPAMVQARKKAPVPCGAGAESTKGEGGGDKRGMAGWLCCGFSIASLLLHCTMLLRVRVEKKVVVLAELIGALAP